MIILLGLQIFKVANQLINSSGGADPLPLHTFPIPFFDSLVLDYKTLSAIDSRPSRVVDNTNQTNFNNKFDSNNNSNEFSKRSGYFEGNHSFPFESHIRKHSKHKLVPKPYPYSKGMTNEEQDSYSYPSSSPIPGSSDRPFDSFNIKPDWNEFEDSIDQSLNEPKNYYPNKLRFKSEEKRDEDRHEDRHEDNPKEINDDSSTPNEDNFDSDYNDPEYPPDVDQTDINDADDIDDEDREEDADSAKYSEEETPECSFGHSYCHFDDQYPEDSMRKAVDKQMDILTQILPESTETFDLVEGVPKEIDENYTYIDSSNDLYNSESSEQILYDKQNELNYRDGGYICPSYVNYIQPKRALNNDGLWKVILNLNESYRGVDYTQHIRIEECVYEKTKCSFAPNYYTSQCIQKYSNERLLAWTPDKGIHLDVFRLPIACSCHLVPNK